MNFLTKKYNKRKLYLTVIIINLLITEFILIYIYNII